MGFGRAADAEDEKRLGELLAEVTPDDLIEYGMIPEFVGRLPVIAPLMPLSVDDLIRIMTEPKNALVRQYKKIFETESASLEFTDDALKLLAAKALDRDTGARALRAVFDDIMMDALFNLPTQREGGEYIVTPEVVRGEQALVSTGGAMRESA